MNWICEVRLEKHLQIISDSLEMFRVLSQTNTPHTSNLPQ